MKDKLRYLALYTSRTGRTTCTQPAPEQSPYGYWKSRVTDYAMRDNNA